MRLEVNRFFFFETKQKDRGNQNKKSSTAEEARIKSMQQQTRQNAISAGAKIPNFISQGSDTASCCFLPRLLQSILRRRRRFGCRPEQHKSALMHHDKKRNVISAGTKTPNCILQGSNTAASLHIGVTLNIRAHNERAPVWSMPESADKTAAAPTQPSLGLRDTSSCFRAGNLRSCSASARTCCGRS